MSGRVAAVVEQSWHRVPGGTAASTVRALDAVARDGRWEVVGVAARHLRGPDPDVAPTVPVRHLPLSRSLMYESWHRLGRPAVQRWTGAVDIVHATGGAIPPADGAALVVTIHDLAFLHRPAHFTRRGVAFMGRAFELARRRADVVIVPSQATADDCVAHGVIPERVRLVPWGVDVTTVTDAERERVRRHHQLPDEFILWVGTAEPRKNLRGLLAAHGSISRDVPLVLVGPSGWGTDIETMIASSRRPVRHIGRVDGADLPALYDQASVFVYPSLLEGFGMPVLEAMAQGTPVVTSARTSTAEVLGGTGVLIEPTDLTSITSAIDELLGDDARRRELGSRGRRRATAMSWEATAQATVAVYDEVRG